MNIRYTNGEKLFLYGLQSVDILLPNSCLHIVEEGHDFLVSKVWRFVVVNRFWLLRLGFHEDGLHREETGIVQVPLNIDCISVEGKFVELEVIQI